MEEYIVTYRERPGGELKQRLMDLYSDNEFGAKLQAKNKLMFEDEVTKNQLEVVSVKKETTA